MYLFIIRIVRSTLKGGSRTYEAVTRFLRRPDAAANISGNRI